MANTHWGTHSSDHLPFNEQLLSSSQQPHEAGTIINTQQSKEKELSSQIIWVLLLLRFLSNLWLLVLAFARTLEITKGRGGGGGGWPGFSSRKMQKPSSHVPCDKRLPGCCAGPTCRFSTDSSSSCLSPGRHKSGCCRTLLASLLLHWNLLSLVRCPGDWNALLFWNVSQQRGCCFDFLSFSPKALWEPAASGPGSERMPQAALRMCWRYWWGVGVAL